MIKLHFIRRLFNGTMEGVREQSVRENANKVNYSRSNISSLSGRISKFVFVAIILAILAGGCIEKKEKIEESPKIGPFLEDELDNYKADDNLELIICTFEELSDKQKGILSNFGEIKESIPPLPSGKLIGTNYWRTILVTEKRYLVNLSKIDFVDKVEKWPSKDSEYLGKALDRLVPIVIGSPNNKSIGVFIEFKHELGDSEYNQLKKLEVILKDKSTFPVTRTVGYTASIPAKNMVRVLRLDFVQSIESSEEILVETHSLD